MPYITIDPSKENSGSVDTLINYLEKENLELVESEKEHFFNQEGEGFNAEEVVNRIDKNTTKLSKDEAKYFSIYISPSEKELEHIKNDKDKLKQYTKDLMNVYASNFNRNLKADDILYYGKLEHNRTYKHTDLEVRNKLARKGELKPGLNTHVHVVVSRKTATKFYKGVRTVDRNGNPLTDDKTIIKRSNTSKISPNTEAKGENTHKLNGNTITKGFNRSLFKENGELLFDNSFNYDRPEQDKYAVINKKVNNPDLSKNKDGFFSTISKDINLQDTPIKKKIYLEQILKQVLSVPNQDRNYYTEKLITKGISFGNKAFKVANMSVPFHKVSAPTLSLFNSVLVPILLLNKLSKDMKKTSKEQENKENEKEL